MWNDLHVPGSPICGKGFFLSFLLLFVSFWTNFFIAHHTQFKLEQGISKLQSLCLRWRVSTGNLGLGSCDSLNVLLSFRDYAESLRLNEFTGSPVLFIPGNGGSYKQVRSLASVSLVMSYGSTTGATHHGFNYFTLDFNEVCLLFFVSNTSR